MSLRHPVTVASLVVGGLIVAVAVAIGVMWFVQRDVALPHTIVAGVDVGGLDADEIVGALADDAARRGTDPVVLVADDMTTEFVPSDLGYEIDLEATAARALARGRDGLPGDIGVRWRALRGSEQHIAFIEDVDRDRVADRVAELAEQLDRDEVEGDVTIDPDHLMVEVTAPVGSVTVRQQETVDLVLAAFLEPGPDEIEIPRDTTPPPGDEAALRAVAEDVERAIAEPLVLTRGETELTLDRSDLAHLIDLEPTDDASLPLEMVVTADSVEERISEVASSRFDVAAVSADVQAPRSPPRTFDAQGSASFSPVEASITVSEGRTGLRFDPERAAEQLTALVRDGARTAEIDLETIEPELTTERARELAPTHLIGTFTTYYAAGQDRSRNIQRLADVINGAVVLPGEQFSINDISGERSCDKGYFPAGTIVRGELVDTCGGGVSQFGTTTFNAAFFAGVQLDQWRAHSWYISRYPRGREATLSYPALDVRFTNDTDGIVVVTTTHSSSSVTVSVYGRPLASQVRAVHGQPTNPTEFSTEHRTTSELREGQERVIQAGTDGFTVEVERIITLIGGGEKRETIRTVYVPQTRIVERGTASD